ncbi:MAG: S8 family serine peptidase [Anaerolineae bacterium]|nr:S8 family serine peptidase [Anaerolineae bacterium]
MRVSIVFVTLALLALIVVLAFRGPVLSVNAAQEGAAAVASAKLIGVSETGLYIVRFNEPSLASYTGGIAGFAATSPQATGERKFDPQSAASQAYADHLQQQHNQFVDMMNQTLGRSVHVEFDYLYALNGMAVQVSHAEAARLATLPGVAAVYADTVRELDTDEGPLHINAPAVWNGQTGGSVATRGQGIIIGVIDSGINSQHPSFAATDGDGYTHTNPYGVGVYRGWCIANPSFCNSKLIGAYGLNPNGGTPEDTDGHGSHTGSTAGGNRHSAVFVVGTDTYTLTVQGVAPRANIVAYKVCNPGCPGSASVQAVNSAIGTDQVDVLNYSISGADSPWTDPVDLAFLDASNAGIYVAASAGNAGPGPSTVAKTGPWNAAVAASTINRVIANTFDVTAPSPPPTLQGLAAVQGTGPNLVSNLTAPIRYGGNDGGNIQGCTPYTAGYFSGAIALIQRGTCTFAIKVGNATAAGAVGVIIFNNVGGPPISMGGLEATTVPSLFLDLADGTAVRNFINATNPNPTSAQMKTDTALIVNNDWEDIVGGFSSRGPSQFEILKPDYIAPGVNILAAVASSGGNPVQYGFNQGTSMSSPHAAGAGALLMALHPAWSPAEIKSALASTAVPGLLKEDGVTPAIPFDEGSGLLNLALASNTGLVLHETGANYAAANPASGGDPKTLNQPSVVNNACLTECTWTRTVKSVLGSSATYTATVTAPTGMTISVTPSTFTIAAGASRVITITADVSGLPANQWAFGSVALETNATHPNTNAVSDTNLPVAVRPAAAIIPDTVAINTDETMGNATVSGIQVGLPITNLTTEVGGLVKANLQTESLIQDPSNGDPYNNDGGTFYVTVTVPSDAMRLVAQIVTAEAPDMDLYVGTGSTPSAGTEVCGSFTPTSDEYCNIDNPAPGVWWILVQNWQGSTSQPDDITLAYGVVTEADAGNMTIMGPTTVPAGTPFSVMVHWNEPSFVDGDVWFGYFTLGTNNANPGNIGLVRVNLYYESGIQYIYMPALFRSN